MIVELGDVSQVIGDVGDLGDLGSFWSRQARRVRNLGKQVGRAAQAYSRIVGGVLKADEKMLARGAKQAVRVVTDVASGAVESMARDVGGNRAARQVRNVARQVRNVVDDATNLVNDPMAVVGRNAERALNAATNAVIGRRGASDPFNTPALRALPPPGPVRGRQRMDLGGRPPVGGGQPQVLATRNAAMPLAVPEGGGGMSTGAKVAAGLAGVAGVAGVVALVLRRQKSKKGGR